MTPRWLQTREVTVEGLAEARNPKISRKRASESKVAIAFKYCYYQIDTTKPSFRDVFRKGEHRASERWINTIYDDFQESCPNQKTRNLIPRETILEVLWHSGGRHKGWLDH